MFDFSSYPKVMPLHGERQITIVPLAEVEHQSVVSFVNRLPLEERNYLWDDLTDPKVFQALISQTTIPPVIPLAGMYGSEVATIWTLTCGEHGWTAHLGTIWGIVEPAWRRSGLGAMMVHELLHFAGQLEMERVVLELVRAQKGPIGHFSKVGFEVAATLKDWTKDHSGRYHDLLILTMKLEPAWRKMEELLSQYEMGAD